MFITEVNDLLQVLTLGNKFSERFPVLSIEELMRTDKCEVSIGFQEAQPGFDEDNVKVVVAFSRTVVFFLIECDKLGSFFLSV